MCEAQFMRLCRNAFTTLPPHFIRDPPLRREGMHARGRISKNREDRPPGIECWFQNRSSRSTGLMRIAQTITAMIVFGSMYAPL